MSGARRGQRDAGQRGIDGTVDTIRRLTDDVEVFALPRLPDGRLDHQVLAAIADLM